MLRCLDGASRARNAELTRVLDLVQMGEPGSISAGFSVDRSTPDFNQEDFSAVAYVNHIKTDVMRIVASGCWCCLLEDHLGSPGPQGPRGHEAMRL